MIVKWIKVGYQVKALLLLKDVVVCWKNTYHQKLINTTFNHKSMIKNSLSKSCKVIQQEETRGLICRSYKIKPCTLHKDQGKKQDEMRLCLHKCWKPCMKLNKGLTRHYREELIRKDCSLMSLSYKASDKKINPHHWSHNRTINHLNSNWFTKD